MKITIEVDCIGEAVEALKGIQFHRDNGKQPCCQATPPEEKPAETSEPSVVPEPSTV